MRQENEYPGFLYIVTPIRFLTIIDTFSLIFSGC